MSAEWKSSQIFILDKKIIVLYINLKKGKVANHVAIPSGSGSPLGVIDLDKNGDIIGIEIFELKGLTLKAIKNAWPDFRESKHKATFHLLKFFL